MKKFVILFDICGPDSFGVCAASAYVVDATNAADAESHARRIVRDVLGDVPCYTIYELKGGL